jgi:diguanylate cyclase (GGDEF)-like protein/PAS domain S-box-containing protein
MTGTYDHRLIALSLAIAVASSYAALDLAGRVRVHRAKARWFWIAGGGSAYGLGIWAMHYIGMLAFHLPVPVLYHIPTVLLSLIAAIVGSIAVLIAVGQKQKGAARFIAGSLIMGVSISVVHYVGMEAMRLPATMHYRLSIVVLSIMLGIVMGGVALLFASRSRNQEQVTIHKIASALLMGLAIPATHYSGMRAAVFTPAALSVDTYRATGVSSLGIMVITGSTMVVLLLVVVAAFVDRFLLAQRAISAAVEAGETNFRSLADAIPQIIWTAGPDGQTESFNRRWFEYSGLTAEQSQGPSWQLIVHPEDLPACLEKLKSSLKTGEPYAVEYRLRNAQGKYRWHLGRAVAVLDERRRITRWLGSCTDIDDQKKTEQALEQQIAQRTAALRDANLKLTVEMRQREQAQRELNRQTDLLVKALTERTRKATLLAKMGELLQNCNHVNEAFPVVASFAPKVFPDIRGAVFTINSADKTLDVAVHWSDCRIEDTAFPLDSCWALRTGRMHQAGTPGAINCAHAARLNSPYICLPVRAQREAVGIMHLQLMGERDLPELEMAILESFAEQVGLSLANIRLREELRAQSIRDPISGLFNRRFLEETTQRELARALRGKHELGVVMLEIDHFRTFNHAYGHDAGDAVVRELGNFLSRNVRGDDIPCRFSEEAFVLVLPGTTLETARLRAEELRQRILNLNVISQGKAMDKVSASVGVACFPEHGSALPELLTAADSALYKAKKNGHNQVVIADRPTRSSAQRSPLVLA